MVSVAALGFGDIPCRAFAEAFNLVLDDGWIAFNIKEEFLQPGESTGFSRLIEHMTNEGAIDMKAGMTYQHRLSTAGEPLDYRIFIARKGERSRTPGSTSWMPTPPRREPASPDL